MNAEALLGITLGTWTLRRLLGRGGMGAVFLADQIDQPRQVAVKVLFPMVSLSPKELPAFLERFRREAEAASSLQHPHIMPVYAYGEEKGLPYLVMPYVDGGTLRDQLEREGALPFALVMAYLEQLAAALDFAHERGMVHRDVKPANILRSSDGRLLLSDFGLVKLLADDPATRSQLSSAGLPLGTPEFMAPEQVLGQPVDRRTDLYALGAILYQMVTGVVPFGGETPMQVAMLHLQTPPPSPTALRPDLPPAAGQVILRALAKRPEERYERAAGLAAAFRQALVEAGLPSPEPLSPSLEATARPMTFRTLRTRRGLLGPRWHEQGAASPAATSSADSAPSAPRPPVAPEPTPAGAQRPPRKPGLLSAARLQAASKGTSDPLSAALSSTAIPQVPFPEGNLYASPISLSPAEPAPASAAETLDLASLVQPQPSISAPLGEGTNAADPALSTGGAGGSSENAHAQVPFPSANTELATGIWPNPAPSSPGVTRVLPLLGAMGTPAGGGNTSALTVSPFVEAGGKKNGAALTGALRLVQIPVAGQPGRYVTGVLPLLTEPAAPEPGPEVTLPERRFTPQRLLQDRRWLLLIALVLLLLLSGSGLLLLLRPHSAPTARKLVTPTAALRATATVQGTPTPTVVMEDPLAENVHNWPMITSGSHQFIFKDGAYHIIDNDDNTMAVAILPDAPEPLLSSSLTYILTMEEIKGDDGSINNQFGMIIRYNQRSQGGKVTTQFYSFEVRNTSDGEYQFWKFDSSAAEDNRWTKIWSKSFGKEYHQGHGANAVNTVKIVANGQNFTFYINGTKVGTAKDGSIATGSIGLLVNLKGTEVAFSNLLVTTP
jgi:serine/threonine protein kinase